MDAFFMEARDESIDGMIECILKLRNDPAMGEYRHLICSVIFLDPAGEWSEKFKAGIDKLKDIGVLVIHRATNADKRQQALAEGFDEVLERQWPADAVLETHTHPFAVSAVVVHGEMWLQLGEHTRHLRPGDRFSLDADEPHAEMSFLLRCTFFFAIFASPSCTRFCSSCVFFSRIATPVRVFERSSTCTAPTRSSIGV